MQSPHDCPATLLIQLDNLAVKLPSPLEVLTRLATEALLTLDRTIGADALSHALTQGSTICLTASATLFIVSLVRS